MLKLTDFQDAQSIWLKNKRKEKKFSLTKLSKLTGIHRTNICKYEAGGTTIDAYNFYKLEAAFGETWDGDIKEPNFFGVHPRTPSYLSQYRTSRYSSQLAKTGAS